MSYTKREKACLGIQSLLDNCAVLAACSKGSQQTEEYEVYFVPETVWYNRVHLHKAADGKLEETVAAVAAAVKDMKLPPLISWVGSDFEEERIAPLLREAGYINPLPVQQVMYLDLEHCAPAVPGLEIQAVPAERIDVWSDVVAAAFGKPSEKAGMRLLAGHPDCDFLMYCVDGEIVAGMLLICKDGNAGIHEVGTLDSQRGKGVATAMINRALMLAREKGCTCATLQASPMGAPLYAKLGFETVDRVSTWMLLPPDAHIPG